MKHCSKAFWEVLDRAVKLGFRYQEKSSGVLIFPPQGCKTQTPYLAHPSERAVHPVRRYVKNQCGFPNFS
jgi:hypothetical protein